MVLYGHLKTEEVGNIIYSGTKEECENHAKTLDLNDYYSLNICQDNGVIDERIVKPYAKIRSGKHG